MVWWRRCSITLSAQTNVSRVEIVEDSDSKLHEPVECVMWMEEKEKRTRVHQKPKDMPGTSGAERDKRTRQQRKKSKPIAAGKIRKSKLTTT